MDPQSLSSAPVVVARHHRRRGAVAQAWAVLAPHLAAAMRPTALIHTTSHRRQPTHPDTLSATFDALLAAGAEQIDVLADSHDHAQRLYAAETWGRPVRLIDRRHLAQSHSPTDVCRVLLVHPGAPLPALPLPAFYLIDAYPTRHRRIIAGTDAAAVSQVASAVKPLKNLPFEVHEAIEQPIVRTALRSHLLRDRLHRPGARSTSTP
ncbi:MAG: hypothetical protein KatS3mg108_3683 [Isosphaeraceae bacterium]|jgi:hypothetical protein|nr:MAG: hypothetical protein KatS3mg108_3683 [Isosphaeraceae bacterium]